MARGDVSAEDFVKAWQASPTTADVIEALGMSPEAVSSRAAHYRRQGIPLKRMPRRGKASLDLEYLKSLCGNGTAPVDNAELPLEPVEPALENTGKSKRKRKR